MDQITAQPEDLVNRQRRRFAVAVTLAITTSQATPTSPSPRLSINGCTIKRYASCPNKDLRGVSLPFVDLYGGCFYGEPLGNSDIHNADIRYANFRNVSLYNVRAEHVSSKGANFRFSQLRRARFCAGDLAGPVRGAQDLSTRISSCNADLSKPRA